MRHQNRSSLAAAAAAAEAAAAVAAATAAAAAAGEDEEDGDAHEDELYYYNYGYCRYYYYCDRYYALLLLFFLHIYRTSPMSYCIPTCACTAGGRAGVRRAGEDDAHAAGQGGARGLRPGGGSGHELPCHAGGGSTPEAARAVSL